MRKPVAALAVLAILLAGFAGLWQPHDVAASDLADVSGWATLGSVTPAAGCWVDASVEVRREGFTIPNVDVAVHLVHDGDVVASDSGVTNGDGLAYLGVDTSWAAPGLEAWLDVLVGGEYAGGMPVSITASGPARGR